VAVGSPVLQEMPTAKARHGQGSSECNVQLTKKLKEMRIQVIVNGRNREKGREMKQYILVHIPRENREIKAVFWIRFRIRSDPKKYRDPEKIISDPGSCGCG
jgi:hypothetical protein